MTEITSCKMEGFQCLALSYNNLKGSTLKSLVSLFYARRKSWWEESLKSSKAVCMPPKGWVLRTVMSMNYETLKLLANFKSHSISTCFWQGQIASNWDHHKKQILMFSQEKGGGVDTEVLLFSRNLRVCRWLPASLKRTIRMGLVSIPSL